MTPTELSELKAAATEAKDAYSNNSYVGFDAQALRAYRKAVDDPDVVLSLIASAAGAAEERGRLGDENKALEQKLETAIAEWAAGVHELTTLRDELAAAKEELDIWKSVFPDIAPESVLPDRSRLEADLAALRKAAEPFAEVGRVLDENYPGYGDHVTVMGWDTRDVTHGNFRALRAELEKQGGRDGGW